MEAIIENLDMLLVNSVEFIALAIEIWGVFLIVWAFLREVYAMVFEYRFDFLKIHKDTQLSASLASALEVLLAAEILKTITINDYRGLVIIGVLIVLRIVITVLLAWEASHKTAPEDNSLEKHQK